MKSISRISIVLTLAVFCTPFSNAQQSLFTIGDGLKAQNLSIVASTSDGSHVVARISGRADRLGVNHDRFADPTHVQKNTAQFVLIETETGEQTELFKDRVQANGFTFSHNDELLAYYRLVDQQQQLFVYDVNRNRHRQVKPKSKLELSDLYLYWMSDDEEIIVGLRPENWRFKADSMYKELTEGPITIQTSDSTTLAWDRVWEFSDRTHLALLKISNGNTRILTDEGNYSRLVPEENGAFLSYEAGFLMRTDYQRTGDSEFEIYKLNLEDSEVDTLIQRTEDRPNLDWNNAGNSYTYAEEGKVFLQKADTSDAVEITKGAYEFVADEDTTELKFSVMRWHPQDESILLRSEKGYHLTGLDSGSVELIYEFPENQDEAPRRSVTHWSYEGDYLYMSYSARDTWERGITRYHIDSQEMEELRIDDDLYSGWVFPEQGDLIVFEQSDGIQPNELFVADSEMNNVRQLTDLNPWAKDKKLSKSELIQYTDIDGDTLYGVLYYPAEYEEGKRYPLVAYVYETFFNNGFSPFINILASQNYFVLRPSVDLEQGYPGEAWMKGVMPAINKLVDRGLVDPNELGLQGISYGGYATNLLITQTDRFKAAVNTSGKVNMISFLGDSPKITTRNYDAAEVGQDRIGQSLWEAEDKYIAHSAIMYADRIETPLLMLTGEGDWNVPETNQREMYYALRRLGKEVKWVHYRYGGHGAGRAGRVEDYRHHWETVLDWYDEHFFPEKEEE
ncbi:MAG: prolyl oligopeptidase family serine peptidase [Balneolales bacterium]|nr:prolyl oligopeptidase family serine peptidase [Balneolales bacterium]